MVTRIVTQLFILCANSVMISCEKLWPDDELYFATESYTGNNMRLDGYYQRYDEEKSPYFQNYFFYRNGVLLDGSSAKISEKENKEELYSSGQFHPKGKSWWGNFRVVGNEIEFERWYSGNIAEVYGRKGVILNDTTFRITESFKMEGGEKSKISVLDEVYRFMKFSPKPDSTNAFVP